MATPPALVFSDLDGTLLDHHSYGHAPAAPALAALRARGIPLILASSKTAAEIAVLHAELGLGTAPAIVENGAGLWQPGEGSSQDASDYRRIRAALQALPAALRRPFTGFGDLGEKGIAMATGLPPEAARAAARRQHSEPGLWTGDDAGLLAFAAALAPQGITARRGGRFLTLSLGGTKAQMMAQVARRYGAPLTVALGDAPNDAEMIEAADLGVIVRNDHGTPLPPLDGEASGRVLRTALPGPAGWNAAILDFLKQLDRRGGARTDG